MGPNNLDRVVPGGPRQRRPLLPGIVLVAVIIAGSARAQNYPWCSNFADGAGTNCGFSTEQQCRITIQGSGGYCDHNNLYRPAAVAPPGRNDVRKHRPGRHS